MVISNYLYIFQTTMDSKQEVEDQQGENQDEDSWEGTREEWEEPLPYEYHSNGSCFKCGEEDTEDGPEG